MHKVYFIILPAALLAFSCNQTSMHSDAAGNFETEETIVSAEGTGKIEQFGITEGQHYAANQVVGYIDTTQLYLKKQQLRASIRSLLSKTPDIADQINVLEEQLAAAKREKQRTLNLYNDSAATRKQLDDMGSAVDLIQKQITATTSSLNTQTRGLVSEIEPLKIQIEQLNDQIAKCTITNPINGVVLTKFAQPFEVAAYGTPLYKIADLSQMTLRVYIGEDQLSQIRTGQEVRVLLDRPDGKYHELPGRITWISDEAEFTPKTVQTKEDRTSMVYAVKIRVKNDGSVKIGMPGEVLFH